MAYSYIGSFTANATTLSASPTIPAGFCIVLVCAETITTGVTVVVNGTTLTQDVYNSTATSGAYSGVVSSGSSLSITGGASFKDITCGVWSWSGTGTFKTSAQANQTASIATTAGDYMFALAIAASTDFNPSTQSPSNLGPGTYVITGADRIITFADWNIVSTNAAFSLSSTAFATIFGVDYTSSGGVARKPTLTLMGVG